MLINKVCLKYAIFHELDQVHESFVWGQDPDQWTWSSAVRNKWTLIHTHISVYSTCTLLLTKKYDVDANLDASDNIISDN